MRTRGRRTPRRGLWRPPIWPPHPSDVVELLPQLWLQTARRDAEGRLVVGGVDMRALAREWGPRHTSSTRWTSGRARGPSATPSRPRSPVAPMFHYAGKAFLCTEVARLGRPGGPSWTSARVENCRRHPGGLPQVSGYVARQQQVGRRDSYGAHPWCGTHRRRLLRRDRAHRHHRPRPRRRRAGHGPRRSGSSAHARIHRDRARGSEVRFQPRRRGRAGRRGRRPRAPGHPGCWVSLPHRQSDLRHYGVREPRPAGSWTCTPRSSTPPAPTCRRSTSAGIRHRLHLAAHPALLRTSWPSNSRTSSGASSRRSAPATTAGSRVSIEPGRAIAGPAGITPMRSGRSRMSLSEKDSRGAMCPSTGHERQHPAGPL